MNKNKYTYTLLYFLFLSVAGYAQRYNFHNYSVAEGLVQSSVNTILQDKRGKLIIGTNAGFSEFDGFNFKNYTKSIGLTDNVIRIVFNDQRNNLWLGTEKGLNLYDGRINIIFNKENGLVGENISGIVQNQDSSIWVSTSKGLAIIKMTADKKYKVTSVNDGFFDRPFESIFRDSYGNIWLGAWGGDVYCLLNTKNSILHPNLIRNNSTQEVTIAGKKYKLVKLTITKAVDGYINYITEDSFKNIWISSWTNGVFKVNANQFDNNANRIDFFGIENLPFKCNRANIIFEDNDHNIWIGSDGFGAYKLKFDPNRGSISPLPELVSNYTRASGLSSNHVTSIFQDNENNFWFGTINSGICELTDESFQNYGNESGLTEANVLSITQNIDGNIWFGTYGGGVFVREDDHFRQFFWQNGLSESVISDITHDRTGNIWVATVGGGINVLETGNFNKSSGNLFRVFGTRQGLSSNFIRKVFIDDAGNVWVGNDKTGIDIIYRESNKLDKYKIVNFSQKDGLISDNITDIIQDSEGYFWVCTTGGINKLSPSPEWGAKPQVVQTFTTANGLPDNFINCIAQDVFGNFWFGSNSNGIYIYKANNQLTYLKPGPAGSKWEFINTVNGLNSTQIKSIIKDDWGNIWTGTNAGINKIEFSKKGHIKKIKSYGKNEGFTSIECYNRAAINDKDGNLWFGTIKGATKYIPREDVPNKREVELLLKDIKIFFHKIDWDSVNTSQQHKYYDLRQASFALPSHWSSLPNELVLPYHQNHITFDFVGICFNNPEKVRYQFMLQGLDDKWNPVTSEDHVTYSNLSPGDYTFRIKACNNNNIWNVNEVTYSFTIEPPFWKRKWFYFLMSAIGLVGLWLFIRYRTIALEKSKRKLEHQVRIRTTEVLIQKEEIEKQKEEIEKKNKDVTDSLNYAKQIQEALLPTDAEIKRCLPDSFVLYMPQHIVSGDFYWFSQADCQGDIHGSHADKNCYMIAAADCTGHGVPGALMSMIGGTILNELVNKKGMTVPGEILHHLDTSIKISLKQDKMESLSRDGMDIALCCIDYKNMVLHFAGALRPLYIFRDGELKVVSSSKFPIGGIVVKEDRSFVNNTIEIKKGDCIYIFSDGYADQFGGPEGKKFQIKNFKKLLKDVHNQPMPLQKMILKQNILEWKGKYDQTDDILVVGVRV